MARQRYARSDRISQYVPPYDQIASLCNNRHRFNLKGVSQNGMPKDAWLRAMYTEALSNNSEAFGRGRGRGGKTRKRPLSKYNLFVRERMKKYAGDPDAMVKIGEEWRGKGMYGRGPVGGSRAALMAKLRYAMSQRGRF